MNETTILRNVLVAQPHLDALTSGDFVLAAGATSADPYSIDLTDHAVLPALVNAHDHFHLNGIPPLPVEAPFRNSYDWAAAFGRHFGQSDVQRALTVPKLLRHWQGALKNALCGATTVMHHDPVDSAFDAPDFPVRACQPYGWAHSLHWDYGPPVADSFRRTPTDVPWFIHLAEGTDELAGGELRELLKLDCVRANTVLIHGVAIDDAGLTQLIERNAALVWCAASNLCILGRTVSAGRIRRLFDAGRLAIGTDSRLSGAHDMLEELRVAAGCSDLSARELVQLATTRSRRVVAAPAAANDVLIIRRLTDNPFEDLLSLKRNELRAVVRDGQPLIADPDFEPWFARRQIAYQPILLDGRPKVCARSLVCPHGLPHDALEPGLTLS